MTHSRPTRYQWREFYGVDFCGPRICFSTSYASPKLGCSAHEAVTVLHYSDVKTVFVSGECLFIVDAKGKEHYVVVDETKRRYSAMHEIAQWALFSAAGEKFEGDDDDEADDGETESTSAATDAETEPSP